MLNDQVLTEEVLWVSQPKKISPMLTRDMLMHWIRRGVLPCRRRKKGDAQPQRITLEWAKLGGQLVTSREAYLRFLRKINRGAT